MGRTSQGAAPYGSRHAAASSWAASRSLVAAGRGVDLCELPDLAGDGEQVVRGVKCLFGGVELVEHGPDECGLAHVLRDADPLGVSCARDGHVAAVGEADRRRV